MLFNKRKAVDANWTAVLINGIPIPYKSSGGKVSRKRAKVIRAGSDVAEAMTYGFREADPITMEIDAMASVVLMKALGVVDGKVAIARLADQEFELVERTADPDKSPLGAGGWTSTGRGCKVASAEWKSEVGSDSPTMFTFVVDTLDWIIAAGDKGGGGFTV